MTEKTDTILPESENKPQIFNVINTKHLNEDKSVQTEYNLKWYEKKVWWFIFGLVPSFLFLLMALFNRQFFILVPFGPITGLLSWYIKKYFKKHNPYKEETLK